MTVVGAAVVAASAWLGTWVGLLTVTLEAEVTAQQYFPATLNLFCLGFFLAGLSLYVSSMDRNRGRTIGLVVGFFVFQIILKLFSRSVANFEWLEDFTILACYEPQILVSRFHADLEVMWWMLWDYNGPLIYFGLSGIIAAGLIFCRRDLPAPL